MWLSIVLLGLLSSITSSIAAPAASQGTSLVARGDVLPEISRSSLDPCKKPADQCVKEHLTWLYLASYRGKPTWKDWVPDMVLLSTTYKDELRSKVNIVDFDEQYADFKTDIQFGPFKDANFPEWDMRIHLAYIWDRLPYLITDYREHIYPDLLKLTVAMYADCGLPYEPGRKDTVTLVMRQMKILLRFYTVESKDFQELLGPVHRRIGDLVEWDWERQARKSVKKPL